MSAMEIDSRETVHVWKGQLLAITPPADVISYDGHVKELNLFSFEISLNFI